MTTAKESKSQSKAKTTAPAKDDSAAALGTRINVYLQQHGVASRRQADNLVVLGRVTLNGKKVTEPGTRVPPNSTVTVDGKPIGGQTPNIVLLFHKPDLHITSRTDPENRATIFDLPALKKLPKNVQSVGRLDFRSEGLLLLTNDGNLAYALTHPKFSVTKTYAVLVSETVVASDLAKLKKGVVLEDGFVNVEAVKVGSRAFLGSPKRGQWVEVVINEGRNRIIRRMMEAIGLKVVRLVRVNIGGLALPEDLKPGTVRPTTKAELEELRKVAAKVDTSAGDVKKSAGGNKRPSSRGVDRKEYQKHLDDRSIGLARKQAERKSRIEKEKAEARKGTGGKPTRAPAGKPRSPAKKR